MIVTAVKPTPEMLRLYLAPLFLAISVLANGEFTILHHPSSLTFKGHDHLKESILGEVYSTALGFTVEHYANWEGLYVSDPFNLAEAIVTVAVDGVADIGNSKGHHFPLKTDTGEAEIYESLERRITEHYPEGNNLLVRIDLHNGLEELQNHDIFQGIKSDKPHKKSHTSLKNNVDEDREFLQEITLLKAIVDKIEQTVKSDDRPDVYWFKVSGLHVISDLYGENSTQAKEAKQLLNEALTSLNLAFKKVYNGNVLVNVITSDAIHTRRTRNILETKDEPTADDFLNLNLAKYYSPDYPVIFNIILWFGVAMVFTLLAICYAIAAMDPGRDSIIYRMTSTRMKKDN